MTIPPEELGSLETFADLQSGQLQRLAVLFRRVCFPAGERVFEAGDKARTLYVLEAGEIIVRFHPYDGEVADVATIRPGGAFGWSAAMRRGHYTASAICLTEVRALAIQSGALRRLMSEDPKLGELLLERILQIASSRYDGIIRKMIERWQASQSEDLYRDRP